MPQLHLHAEVGDYAPLVLLPGDPNRARTIATRFDGGTDGGVTRLVNDNRGMLGYTGTYQGRPVSVQSTGMGTPSLSIVGDLVIASSAAPTDGATQTYLHGEAYAPTADFALTHSLYHAAEEAGIPTRVGQVASVDVFYNPDADYAPRWRDRGVLAFEMEASALFYLAARAGVQAACLLVVSDLLSEKVSSEESYVSPDELAAAVDRMTEVALRVGLS